MSDQTIVPECVPDIGGKTFAEVFKTKPIFVDFVVCEITDCTGFFKDFQHYCLTKIKTDGRHIDQNTRGTSKGNT